jgi:gliding motility-associated-like protein
LYASGGNSYIWSPSSSLNNANIFNPIASPISTTTYYVTVTDANKCSAKDSIKITVNPLPAITKSKDTSLCRNTLVQLFASGGSIYLWSPSTSLNNANISNPIATPASTTTYNVTVTDANKCSNNDSISITVTSSSVFTVSPDQDICKKDSNQLFAAGGTTYLWSPSSSLSNPNIANPIATPDATTVYSVKIKDNNCNDSTTLSTKISVLPLPAIKASKTNDINCSNNSSQLNVTGGKQYLWQPGISLTDSNIYNPIAKPLITTTYHVTGVDINGCKNFDSVTVKINFNTTGNYNLPNAFTPNGDGINDCFGLKFWVDVTELDFSIYNRFGQRVFHTANAADCWDGKYKGIPQNIGIYISVIKAKTACGVIDRKSEIMLLR